MTRALALIIVAACGSDQPAKSAVVGREPTRPPRTATPWQSRCIATLERLREAAAVYEPALRTAEITLDDVREEVILAAGPPVWDIPSIHIFAVHEVKPQPANWQRFAEPFHGVDHVTWQRTAATSNAAILLDGWEADRARRLEPTLVNGVEPCVAP